MFDDDRRSGTETTCGTETGGDGSDKHVDLGGGDIVKFGETTASSSNCSEREGFVENETILVLVFEFDLWHSSVNPSFMMLMDTTHQFRQVGHRTITFKNTFGDDESASQRSPSLPALLADTFQDLLKTLHVVMVEPTDSATRDLEALLNRKIDVSVCNDDIPTLGEGRYDGRNRSERLRVENSIFGSKEIRDVLLEVSMNVNCAVETCWTATSETVFPESLGSLLLYVFIASKTGKVEACEVYDSLSGANEFGFRTSWTRNDGK